METACNCRQFQYWYFKLQNIKKHAFCNGDQKYGNCLQLYADSLFELYVVKSKKKCILQRKTRIQKLPTIVGTFRIWFLIGITPKSCVLLSKTRIQKLPTIVGRFRISILNAKMSKNMCFAMETANTETANRL